MLNVCSLEIGCVSIFPENAKACFLECFIPPLYAFFHFFRESFYFSVSLI